MPSAIREQVLEQIIDVIRAAEEQGLDEMRAVQAAFPGTPEGIYWNAWAVHDSRKIEGWWRAVEKTIDGEIIKAALLKGVGK